MKQIVWIMAAFLFLLAGCARAEADKETDREDRTISTEAAPSAPGEAIEPAEPEARITENTGAGSMAAKNMPASEAPGLSAVRGGDDAALTLTSEMLTAPPALVVSTQNNTDQVITSSSNYEWSRALPDGTTVMQCACGAHPLDHQEHPLLYTAFPAGTLPPAEEGADTGSMLPVFYLDFGVVLPETVSAVRWPASCLDSAQQSYKDYQEVPVEMEGDTITLAPLEDGDFVYLVTAQWGETGSGSYTFRTLPQMREEQEAELPDILDALKK